MSVNAILNQMISEAATVPLEKEGRKFAIKLRDPKAEEFGAKAKRSEVWIRDAPPDAFIIRADEFPAPKNFFQGDHGENKRADFIIISAKKEVILYIEIKSGGGDAGDIKKQLNGAACVLNYCKEVGKRFWREKKFLDGYDQRYIGIVNIGENRIPFTRPRRKSGHDVENYMRISSPHRLYFSHLLK